MDDEFLVWFVIAIVCAELIWLVLMIAGYYASTYYRITKKGFFQIRRDRGSFGEYQIYVALKHYEKDGARFLFNCYMPGRNGGTTEADVIMLHSSGVYVFESKNFSGWIFGSDQNRNWVQSLPQGKKAKKIPFYNPVKQNDIHINALCRVCGNDLPIHSVIVFSNRCKLKAVKISRPAVTVTQLKLLRKDIKTIMRCMEYGITRECVEVCYDLLYPYTQVTVDIKQDHIATVMARKSGGYGETQWFSGETEYSEEYYEDEYYEEEYYEDEYYEDGYYEEENIGDAYYEEEYYEEGDAEVEYSEEEYYEEGDTEVAFYDEEYYEEGDAEVEYYEEENSGEEYYEEEYFEEENSGDEYYEDGYYKEKYYVDKQSADNIYVEHVDEQQA